jgi:hypothetical protein
MNQIKLLISTVLVTAAAFTSAFSQTPVKEFKAGHIFYVSLPEYMSKTTGLNSASIIQFKNVVKDIAGFIIEDNKEELALAQMSYSSLNEFYEDFIKDFLEGEKKRTISPPVAQSKGEYNFIQCDATYYDKDIDSELYYFVGIAETKDAYYKILCFGGVESKDKYKKDFENIMLSIRD